MFSRILCASGIGFLAYLTIRFNQIPVPDDFEEPYRYRMVSTFITLSGYLLKTLNVLNNKTEIENLKALDNYFKPKTTVQNVQIVDKTVEGIGLRIYRLSDQNGNSKPSMIYYHGGGFSLGNLDTYDSFLSLLVEELNIAAISIDYRLAPENPFPIPTDDCYNATKYILENSDEFLVDPNRIVIAGDSAGGNIVAAVSQRLLKEGRKLPKLQVLLYPWIQMFDMKLPSFQVYNTKNIYASSGLSFGKAIKWYLSIDNRQVECLIENNQLYSLLPTDRVKQIRENLDVKLISSEFISDDEREYYKKYNPGFDQYSTDELKALLDSVNKNQTLKQELLKAFTPEVSPVIAEPERIKGLPKAYFAIPEWDTLKDEGLIYAERLKRAGVDVTVQYYKGAFHGILSFQDFTKAKNIIRDLIRFLKQSI